jgi:hypothetical protein
MLFFFETPAPNTFLAGFLPAIIGALVGGFFVIWAFILQQHAQETAAVRALILEMLHNSVILSSWTRSASEQPSVPQFPVLGRSVFDQQLPLVSKRLSFRELVAVLQAYTAVFVLGPGMGSLAGRPKLSAENVQNSKRAAERFFNLSNSLSKKFLTRKERRDAEPFFASGESAFSTQPQNNQK